MAALVVAQVEARLTLANALTWLGVSLDGTLAPPLDTQLMTSALALLVPAVVTTLQDNKEALDTLRTALVERCSAGEIKKVRGAARRNCAADILTCALAAGPQPQRGQPRRLRFRGLGGGR